MIIVVRSGSGLFGGFDDPVAPGGRPVGFASFGAGLGSPIVGEFFVFDGQVDCGEASVHGGDGVGVGLEVVGQSCSACARSGRGRDGNVRRLPPPPPPPPRRFYYMPSSYVPSSYVPTSYDHIPPSTRRNPTSTRRNPTSTRRNRTRTRLNSTAL